LGLDAGLGFLGAGVFHLGEWLREAGGVAVLCNENKRVKRESIRSKKWLTHIGPCFGRGGSSELSVPKLRYDLPKVGTEISGKRQRITTHFE